MTNEAKPCPGLYKPGDRVSIDSWEELKPHRVVSWDGFGAEVYPEDNPSKVFNVYGSFIWPWKED